MKVNMLRVAVIVAIMVIAQAVWGSGKTPDSIPRCWTYYDRVTGCLPQSTPCDYSTNGPKNYNCWRVISQDCCRVTGGNNWVWQAPSFVGQINYDTTCCSGNTTPAPFGTGTPCAAPSITTN